MPLSSDPSLVQVEIDEHGVALVKLNRPEKRNALSQALIDSLAVAIATVERDEKVRVVVLTGSRPAGPFSGTEPLISESERWIPRACKPNLELSIINSSFGHKSRRRT